MGAEQNGIEDEGDDDADHFTPGRCQLRGFDPCAFVAGDRDNGNQRPETEPAEQYQRLVVAIGDQMTDSPNQNTGQHRMPDPLLHAGFALRHADQIDSDDHQQHVEMATPTGRVIDKFSRGCAPAIDHQANGGEQQQGRETLVRSLANRALN